MTALLYKDQMIALASLIQALSFASSIALTGACDEAAAKLLTDAIYKIDTPSCEMLYPPAYLTEGLRVFQHLFDQKNALKPAMQTLARYIIKINRLAAKLHAQPTLARELNKRLKQAKLQDDFFQHDSERGLVALSEIYLWLAQALKVKFTIIGQAQYLHDPHRTHHIRALLLASIRAAVLWQQLGGNAWRLWWHRKAYLHTSKQLMQPKEPLPTT